MSTKTTIKRVALVAVSALGFGLVSAIAPASAAITSTNPYLTPVTYSGSATPNATFSTYVITHQASTGGYVDFTASSNITSDSTILGASFTVTGSTVSLSAPASRKYAYVPGTGITTNASVSGSTVSGGTIGGGTLMAASVSAATTLANLLCSPTASYNSPYPAWNSASVATTGAVKSGSGASTTLTITTATDHKLAVGDVVTLDGLSANNGSWVVDAVGSTTEFAIIDAGILATGGDVAGTASLPIASVYSCNAGADLVYLARVDDAVLLAANLASADVANAYFRIATSTAGSVTAVLSVTEVSGGVATVTPLQTFNIVLSGATAAYKASTSTMVDTLPGWLSSESEPTIYAPRTAGTTVGTITVAHLNSSGAPATIAASPAVTVALSGVGSLTYGAVTAGYIAIAAATEASSVITIKGDGRAGTGTITVTANGVIVDTHTVKFYGNAAKVEAVGILTTAKANDTMGSLDYAVVGAGPDSTAGSNNDPAIAVLVTDALGTPLPPLAVLGVVSNLIATSSNPIAVPASFVADSFVDSGSGLYSAGVLYNHISYDTGANASSGDTSTLTFSVLNASDATVITSNPITVTIGGGLKTLTMKADKETYAPGEKITLSFEGKDALGNAAYDYVDLFYAVSANTQFGGTLPSDSNTFLVGGKATKTLFAPVVPGTFTITATLNDFSAVTSTIKVAADTSALDAVADAAAEAIDAANAATDAANLAAEAADAATVAAEEARDAADAATAAIEELATQVATLMAALKAQITTLANTVAKIAKKIKA